MKAAVMDIESSALEGIGAGMLICACVRPLSTNRTRTFRLDDTKYKASSDYGFFERQERDLLTALLEELRKYDLLIGHNLDNFDLGFLRTRAYRLNVPFDLYPFTFDTMASFRRVKVRTVMNNFGKPSASLAMIADLLGIDQLKTAIYPVKHWQNIWGKEAERLEALNNLADHCRRDVKMTAEVYEMLLPLDRKGTLKRWL